MLYLQVPKRVSFHSILRPNRKDELNPRNKIKQELKGPEKGVLSFMVFRHTTWSLSRLETTIGHLLSGDQQMVITAKDKWDVGMLRGHG